MYIHPAFRIEPDEALEILETRAFGVLVVAEAGPPTAVHVPFLVHGPADQLRISMHVAKANPIHGRIGSGCSALLICAGPDAYISPDSYGVENQVPTWTYEAVHVTGRIAIVDAGHHLDHVDRLSAKFEARLAPKPPWTSDKMLAKKRAAMLRAIVGLELAVETVEAQRKLIQHKGRTEHLGAIDGLRQTADPAAHRIADIIAQTAARKFGDPER